MNIKRAIIPVAGLGTRFLPATKSQSKEMLAVFDTPVIDFIAREAVEAGIKEIVFVNSEEKESVKNYFSHNDKLESELKSRGKIKELELIQGIPDIAKFSYAIQDKPLGDGHAILCAEDFLKDEAVVVLFGDDLVSNPNGPNAVEQLIDIYEKTGDSVILLEEVKDENIDKYGIVEMEDGIIKSIVEKPSKEDALSNLGVVGKFVLTADVLEILKNLAPEEGDSEIRLTNALKEYIRKGGVVRGKVLEGVRFDTGDKLGLLSASIYYALQKEGDNIKDILRKFLG